MNGLNQISVTEIFDRKRNFNGIVFSDTRTFVEHAAEYVKKPRYVFKRDPKIFGKQKKIRIALMRTSDYAFENFKKLKYQGLWWNNGDIEAIKMQNYKPCLVVARGIEAVTKLVEEDGF